MKLRSRRILERGFTLPEVLVSAVLLGTLAVGVAPLSTNLTRTVRDAGDNGDAQRMLLQALEQLRMSAHGELTSAGAAFQCVPGAWDPNVKKCVRPATATEGKTICDPVTQKTYRRSCTLCPVSDGMRGTVVQLTLKWKDGLLCGSGGTEPTADWTEDFPYQRSMQLFKRES